MIVFEDIETQSECDLPAHGAYRYATDPTTDILFVCFACDSGPVQTWRPGDPVPAPFTEPLADEYVWDNWTFERYIHEFILTPRYGFASIPLERTSCTERLALANAYPAKLGLRCEALDLPFRKNPEAHRALLRVSRPKKHKYKSAEARERDLALVHERCKTDVEGTRACYLHPRLRPLSANERPLLLLDAKTNRRGVRLNVPFVEAGVALAIVERNAANVRLSELTSGVVTSVFQRDRILAAVNARGHNMAKLNKRAVAATLAHKAEDYVRALLVLRQRGALNSALKFKKMLAFADPTEQRLRDTLRYHGAHTGRWSSIGPQVHNMKRNDAELPASLINAVLAGNRAELARWGNPLNILSGLMRAALCAADGHKLYWADFAAVESRVLAWFAGEEWKLAAFREYDASGDERLHPYRQIAARMLHKDVLEINKSERQKGKSSELACGYGGSVGAWRNIIEDPRSDAEIKADIWQWREAHPQTRVFWDRLGRAVRIAVRSRRAIRVNPEPAPSVIAAFDGYTLTLELPSGRIIPYPGARLVPNNKFEDGDPDVEYLDNSKGLWRYKRAWFGILVENVVSGAARDLLADALLRADARGWKVVFHCHDEITIEAPDGVLSERDLLALMLEPPTWAAGLPLGGKAYSGPIYFEGPATAEPPAVTEPREVETAGKIKIEDENEIEVEHALDAFIAEAPNLPNTKEVEQGVAAPGPETPVPAPQSPESPPAIDPQIHIAPEDLIPPPRFRPTNKKPPPVIELTKLTKDGGPLTKCISLTPDGTLKSDGSACVMARGVAERVKIDGVDTLGALIKDLSPSQALALGTLRADLPDKVEVTKKTLVNGVTRPDVIARTGANIIYRGPAFALLDFDTKGMPAQVAAELQRLGGFWEALASVLPALIGAARVTRRSTSSGLSRSDTGEPLLGSDGVHVYVEAKDGADIERFLKTLHERCWLAGLGWLMVSSSGAPLERSIVDRMVGGPERLVFEGGPVLAPPLQQDRESRRPIAVDGGVVDTVTACPPLTIVERARLEERKVQERERLAPELAKARAAFIAAQAKRLVTRTGMPPSAAEQTILRQCEGILRPELELPFDDPELAECTVGDVLTDPERFVGETLADPLEGVGYGKCVAKIMRRADGTPWIHSFAHGRTIYVLKHDAASVHKAMEKATKDEVVTTFARLAANADLDAVELAGLRQLAKKLSGAGLRVIDNTLKSAQQQQAAQNAKAARAHHTARRQDPRPQIRAPFPDEPWLPQMAVANEVVGRNPAAKPPARDIDDAAVRTRKLPLPNTHAFTAAEANVEQEENANDEAAPAGAMGPAEDDRD